ncbi:AAA family ATPase [Candidatus Bathyarchaeota archaeon A05DMB-2]|jgi:CO dehydrogenase maturation factor|nr:AAA family ATPase [Candidatus Bathyarchaeota archaeon A05DMB-2]
MKILICGKGGSGKSTIASLLAKDLKTKGYRVLVVDTDESNYGLSAQLGLKDPKELMDQLGGKKTVVDKMWSTRSAGEKAAIFSESWSIDEIPSECVSKKDNMYLLQIGKVKHFGEGCACPMGGLSRDFLTSLKLEPKDIAIIDTEAGVEHLGRGIASGADVILLVIDPTYESIRLSEKVSAMAKEAGKSVHFILNKMDQATADKISGKIGKESVAAVVPFSQLVQDKGLSGEELDTPVAGIANITTFVLNALQGGTN